MMQSLSFLRFPSPRCSALVMFVCIGLSVNNFNDIRSPVCRAATVVVEIYSLTGMVAGLTANFWPFCSRDFSSGVSSFLERLITHLSWILEVVEEVTAMLKVLAVLEAVFAMVVEHLEIW